MGFFSGSEKIYVSSVVYNLAGDIEKRVDYLKTTVVSAVLGGSPSIADSIRSSYMNGPGLKLKSFARWARQGGYSDDIGLVGGTITSGHEIDTDTVAAQITHPTGKTLELQSVIIKDADYTYWADQYVAENAPDKIPDGYTSEIITTVGALPPYTSSYVIDITYADLTTASFVPTGFNPRKSYMYATYVLSWTAMESGSLATYYSAPQIFIYQKESGNTTLDAMWQAPDTLGNFFPFIPCRINNQKVSDLYPDTIYPESKKALKRAIGAKYDELMAKIETNPSISDIDYAYIVFGASLNTKENAAKKYIYKFFKTIMEDPNQSSQGDFDSWTADWAAARDSWDAWYAWYEANHPLVSPGGGELQPPPEEDNPPPRKIPFPTMPINSMSVTSDSNAVLDYNITISWAYIFEETGTGLYKVDGKKGDLWIELTTTDAYSYPIWTLDPSTHHYVLQYEGVSPMDAITVTWQTGDDEWSRLTIVGLEYNNAIYRGKSVVIGCREAMEDTHESGFIVPLHEDIYGAMSIKDFTQMSTACCYIIFNCYEVVKSRWYETWFFKLLLMVALIVIAVIFFPAATTAAVGLLGTNGAVGAAILGAAASATLIAIVGAIANALAAMVLVLVIGKISIAAFGDKLGTLIAAIASMIAMTVGTGLASGQSFSSMFHALSDVNNIMNLTTSVGNGVAQYIQAGAKDIMGQITAYQNQLNKQLSDVENKYIAEFGYGQAVIDPMLLTDSSIGSSERNIIMEPVNLFLTRTLMTGSDIADLSMSMIHNFADLTLNTDLLLST